MSVFLCNWLLCTLIVVSHTISSSNSCEMYNRAFALYVDTMKNQCDGLTINDTRFLFIVKCAMKTSILLIGFAMINYAKFSYLLKENNSFFHFVLFMFLFVPSCIMIMASNRFYVATAFILYLVVKNNNNIRALDEGHQGICQMREISLYSRHLSKIAASRVNVLAVIHANLHQLFVDFNMMYAKYIVLILGFCFVNVVFEVSTCGTIFSANGEHYEICIVWLPFNSFCYRLDNCSIFSEDFLLQKQQSFLILPKFQNSGV